MDQKLPPRFSEQVETALSNSLERLPASCRHIAAHILKAGGKRLRPLLTVLCARLLGYAGDDIYNLACSFEMLHAATLLHDDVLDKAATRRGQKAAHAIFGETRAILAGDALLAAGNAQVAEFGDPAMTLCFSLATIQTAAGEIREMDSLHNPRLTAGEYIEIASGKTGCLIAQACVMGALAAKADEARTRACGIYGQNLGLAFQIVDDVLDFESEAATGKPRGGDLREGKMTPPLRLYRESLGKAETEDFDQLFSTSAFSESQIEKIAEAIKTGGFADEARKLADSHLALARGALAGLPDSPEKEILASLTDYVRDRRK